MTYRWSMTGGEHPDDGHMVDDLPPHGWSPGGYSGPCRKCDGEALGAKRIRCCRACALKSLEAWRAKPVVIERREFWWITSEGWGHTNPTLAEVTFRDDVAHQVCAIRADEIYRAADCVLIEPVLPSGRALTIAAICDAFEASDKHDSLHIGRLQVEAVDWDGEPTGRAFTLIDGYVDLQRVAEILNGRPAP